MRAIQIVSHDGPAAVQVVDIDEPPAKHPMSPDGSGVLIDVHAAGVSFPELLQTRGMYQFKPDLPFVPGSEFAGTVREAPDGSGFSPGDRVAAFGFLGGFAETAAAPPNQTFKLHDELDFAQGAGLILNYHTAWFALKMRGRIEAGDSVLVHGAAGGVGTATIQVAKGLGAGTVVAVVSSAEKEAVARQAGADEVVRSDSNWREQAAELTGGGVDIVMDPVGGDRFTDSLRALKRGGRVLVVGFTAGDIPTVKVNRLLLRNTEVVGAAWGEWAMSTPSVWPTIGAGVEALVESGHVRPIVGARFPLTDAAKALELLDTRGATGKVVLEMG
ncbi:MAG: NADPH:quinone reductase [Solirubrobacteraceae bacterium]|nr:NADPH:quinone reductase [Solirubrobacteraceae bacterium]